MKANAAHRSARDAWALRLYAALTWAIQPLLRLKLARRARLEPGYGAFVEERFGFYQQPPASATLSGASKSGSPLIWLHAVSLGETRTAALLLPLLRQRFPGMRLLLTHSTATGRTEGQKLLLPGDIQVWLPWDSQAAVSRFFDHFQPGFGLLMETEVWPLLLDAARLRKIPMLLLNARLSDKSLHQAVRLAALARPAYANLTAVLAQTENDASRFRQLGAQVTDVLGNIKFDATPDAAQQAQGRAWRQALQAQGVRVLLLASSREGEESEFFKAFRAFDQQTRARAAINLGAVDRMTGEVASKPQQHLRILALVVPRHPQRFDEVVQIAAQQGLRVARRSNWFGELADDPPPLASASASESESAAYKADIWIGDSLGEMALYYSIASAALLGGSFGPWGGQNLIEAAACDCPVYMGPHTFNFAEVAQQAEAEGAAFRAADMSSAFSAATGAIFKMAGMPPQVSAVDGSADVDLLDNRMARPSTQASAQFALRHRGAAQRTVEAIDRLLVDRISAR